MIEYINKRMNDWAAWAKRRDDGGLGYPGMANFCAMRSISAVGSGPVVIDSAAMEIEGIVTRIRSERKDLYEVAHWIYLAGNLTSDRVARELGCSNKTVYNRLHYLHLVVMDALHDITIEAQDRARENKFLKCA